jgi:glutathione S-transferase
MPNEEVRRKWATVSESGYSEDELADARRRLGNSIARLEDVLASGGPWLLGEAYSLADIKWYSMARALPRVMPERGHPDAAPGMAQWLERMAARPAVRRLADYAPRR